MKKIILASFAIALLIGCSSKTDAQTTPSGAITAAYKMADTGVFNASVRSGNFSAVNSYVYPTKGDTVVNTGTTRLAIRVSGSYPVASFQFIGTKVSGTAAGTVYLQGSNDGFNWITLNDTVTQTNVTTNSHIWVVPSPNAVAGKGASTSAYKDNPYMFLPYLYYSFLVTGSGTMKSYVYGFANFRH